MSRSIYSNHAKSAAREIIWRTFAAMAGRGGLIMPESHGYEVPEAFANGFSLEELLFVDASPQKMAWFTHRVLTPLVGYRAFEEPLRSNRRAGWLSNACKYLYRAGKRVCVAHLDFCGNLDGPLLQEIKTFLQCGLFPYGLLAVTVAASHDARAIQAMAALPVNKLYRFQNKNHAGRVAVLYAHLQKVCDLPVSLISAGSYYNQDSKSPMVWSIFEIHKGEKQNGKTN